MRRKYIVFSALSAVVAAAAIWAYINAFARYSGESAIRIFIPENCTAEAAADSLRSNLGNKFGGKVLTMWRLQGYTPASSYGSYVVEPGQTAFSLARRLHMHRQSPIKVTFNNLRTFDQLAERISEQMLFTSDQFKEAADTMLPKRGFNDGRQFIAAFVPDTYQFYATDNAARVIEKLVDEWDKLWTAERRTKAKQLGLSEIEVATVASIVDEETANVAERPMVARLYLNRLHQGMKLQADPTVKFALGDFSLRRIYGDMLKTNSPYNTYVVNGLPPGPIRIVERADIDAVLDAPQHSYIYMCAKPDFSGTHNFTANYNEHLNNARAYREALDKRNIK